MCKDKTCLTKTMIFCLPNEAFFASIDRRILMQHRVIK
jgi:hypothetical protein